MCKFSAHLEIRMTHRHIHDPKSDLNFLVLHLKTLAISCSRLAFISILVSSRPMPVPQVAMCPHIQSPPPALAKGRVLSKLGGLLAKQQRVAGF